MYELFKKYWKRFFLSFKIAIVFGAFYMIYVKFKLFKLDENQIIYSSISVFWCGFFIFMMLLMSSLNWLLEIYKWKTLISTFKAISIFEAMCQSLSAHTAALFTPFKLADFGMKLLYFDQNDVKKVVFLNFLANFSQLFITILLGIIGLYCYQFKHSEILGFTFFRNHQLILLLILLGLTVLIFFLIRTNKFNFFKKITLKIHLQNVALAFLRYLIFSHQFLLLLYIFKPDLDYLQAISAIFSIYLLASIIPTLALFDWIIKGSIAVSFLNVLGFHVETILLVSLLMWIFNFALPAVLGSYFVLTFPSAKIVVHE